MIAKSFNPDPPVEYAYGDKERKKIINKTGMNPPLNLQPKILHLPVINY